MTTMTPRATPDAATIDDDTPRVMASGTADLNARGGR